MANTITRRARDKWLLSKEEAKELDSSIHAKWRAFAPGVIVFPKQGKRRTTDNHWQFGWCPNRSAWVATNGKRAWRFRDLLAMRSFRDAMHSWNWNIRCS